MDRKKQTNYNTEMPLQKENPFTRSLFFKDQHKPFFFFCLPLRNMAPLASALSDTVILEPRPSRLGGTCWEAGLGNPEAPSAECLVLRRCFCQLYPVCRCAGGSAESLCLQGPPRSCHDLNRGLVPCGGAAIGWSHAHGRCPHHQLGPEAGAI